MAHGETGAGRAQRAGQVHSERTDQQKNEWFEPEHTFRAPSSIQPRAQTPHSTHPTPLPTPQRTPLLTKDSQGQHCQTASEGLGKSKSEQAAFHFLCNLTGYY